MSRRNRWTAIACTTLTALALLSTGAGVASAQEKPDPLTYVAEWVIARDQWAGFAEWTARHHKPILKRLAADGTLLDWGIYETYIHVEGRETHGIWWTAASFAGIEKTRVELLKAPFHPAAAAGAHHDYLLHTMAGAGKGGAISGGFLSVNMQEVKAGHEKEWRDAWEKYSKPVLDEMVTKGILASYALQAEDVHTGPRSTRFLATVSRSAEAEDQIGAAWDAANARYSDAEREVMRDLIRETTVMENHRDYFARVSAGWVK